MNLKYSPSYIVLCLMTAFTTMNALFAATGGNSDKIVAVYYENSSEYRPASGHRRIFDPQMIDTNVVTDIYYAFAYFGYVTKSLDPANPHLTGDFSIQPTEKNDQSTLYPQIIALKQRSPQKLKVFLSIGGWSFNDENDAQGAGQVTFRLFSQMVATSTNRKQFIDSAIAYAHKYGFDGIDIDWEYPGDLRRGGTVEDFSNFILFLKECSEAFHTTNPPLLLSYAVPAFVPQGIPNSHRDDPNIYFQWVAECSRYLDRINIMTYDYHVPFGDPKITGANAPLNHDTEPSSILYIAKTLEYYLSNGVPASKILLGLPTFGHSYGGVMGLAEGDNGPGKMFMTSGTPGPSTRMPGFLAYYEIADMITQKQLTFGIDPLTSTAYGYQLSGKTWVSFDTPETIALKAQLALSKGLGGVFFWSVDMDEYEWEPKFPNIRSARKVLYP